MPVSHRPRPAPCSHCGDTVLIGERTMRPLLGRKLSSTPQIWVEHADPSPEGEIHDGVDDECRRERVAP